MKEQSQECHLCHIRGHAIANCPVLHHLWRDEAFPTAKECFACKGAHHYTTCGVAARKQQLYRYLHIQNPQRFHFTQAMLRMEQLQANVVSLENALNESEAKLKEAELAKGILEKKRENEVTRERELRMVFEAAKIELEQHLRKELLTLKEENRKMQEEANARDLEMSKLREQLQASTKYLDRIAALEKELKTSKKEADENRELLNQSRKEADEIQAKYDQLAARMEELETNTIANANANVNPPEVAIVEEVNRGDYKWLPGMKREAKESERTADPGGTVTIDEEEPTTRKHPIQDFLLRQVKKEEPRQEEEEEQRPMTSGGHQVRENNALAGPSNNNTNKNKMLLRERKQRPNYYEEGPREKKMKR